MAFRYPSEDLEGQHTPSAIANRLKRAAPRSNVGDNHGRNQVQRTHHSRGVACRIQDRQTMHVSFAHSTRCRHQRYVWQRGPADGTLFCQTSARGQGGPLDGGRNRSKRLKQTGSERSEETLAVDRVLPKEKDVCSKTVLATLLFGTGAVMAALFCTARSAEAEPSDELKVFMQAKLEHSQKLLQGLVVEDFESIKKESQELSLLSQATTWQVLTTDEYLQHSREFRRAAEDIAEAAKKKNLEGAALGYVDMTMSCVRCHKYVRGVRTADLGSPHKTRTAR